MNPGTPQEQSFAVPIGKLTIGRTKDNDVSCLHRSLSRHHAQIESDGHRVRVIDLESKNGLYFNGRKVPTCDVVEGDTFRCGDIAFLVEGVTGRTPSLPKIARTLPSPQALDAGASRRPTNVPSHLFSGKDREKGYFASLIRAGEILVSDAPPERVVDELVALVIPALDVDRVVLLTRASRGPDLTPRVVKVIVDGAATPFSRRVVEWTIQHGSASTFGELATDRSLPGDPKSDAEIQSAIAAPIALRGRKLGVLYADNLAHTEGFRPADLTFLSALANIVAATLEIESRNRVPTESALLATEPEPRTLPRPLKIDRSDQS